MTETSCTISGWRKGGMLLIMITIITITKTTVGLFKTLLFFVM